MGPSLSELIAKQPLALPAPTAKQIAATKPRMNVGKLLNRNLHELSMSQVITKDGTHVRYYRDPGSNKIKLKTADKGILHQEWAYGKPGEVTYLKDTGSGDRYLFHTDGKSTRIVKENVKYKDGINQTLSEETLVSNQGKRTLIKGFNGDEKSEIIYRLKNDYLQKTRTMKIPLKGDVERPKVDYSSINFDDNNLLTLMQTSHYEQYAGFKKLLEQPMGFLEHITSAFKP